MNSGKVAVFVLYPNEEGKNFNIDYYRDNHMVMVDKLLTPHGLIDYGIDSGVAGMQPGQPAPFICIGWMTFGTMEEFQAAFEAEAEKLLADIPNFTDVEPVVQISEIVK